MSSTTLAGGDINIYTTSYVVNNFGGGGGGQIFSARGTERMKLTTQCWNFQQCVVNFIREILSMVSIRSTNPKSQNQPPPLDLGGLVDFGRLPRKIKYFQISNIPNIWIWNSNIGQLFLEIKYFQISNIWKSNISKYWSPLTSWQPISTLPPTRQRHQHNSYIWNPPLVSFVICEK